MTFQLITLSYWSDHSPVYPLRIGDNLSLCNVGITSCQVGRVLCLLFLL